MLHSFARNLLSHILSLHQGVATVAIQIASDGTVQSTMKGKCLYRTRPEGIIPPAFKAELLEN
jgi:hypothetical protein